MDLLVNIFEHVRKIIIQVAKTRGIHDDNILDKITAEPPKEEKYGDVSSNIALLCSKSLNMNPRDLAESIGLLLKKNDYIDEVKIAGPGFINLTLNKSIFYECCKNVLEFKSKYGSSSYGKSDKVNIEYVSANPTGPMHIGHARGAVFGDSLANLLQYVGYNVTREYYINDSGQQIINLAKSVYLRYVEILTNKEALFEDDLYPGEYLIPVAENAISSKSMRPLDIIKTASGINVEIGNTDAEGRLVLADAFFEANKDKSELLVDFSALTGAARVALGTELPAIFSKNEKISNMLIKYGERIADPVWKLPLHKPYERHLLKENGSISSTGSSQYGGAITAALFLSKFMKNDINWVHVDLMGWNLTSQPGRPKGGEAMSLRTFFNYIKKLSQNL